MNVITSNFTTTVTAEDILPLARLKEHCRIDYDDEDTILASYRAAAIEKIQGLTGRMLDRVTVEFYAESFHEICLPWSPVVSITNIQYKTTVSDYATLGTSNYWVDLYRAKPKIHFKNIPTVFSDTSNKIKITAEVGYDASAGNTPEALIAAVRLLAKDLYEFRGDELAGVIVRTVPNGIMNLISEYRIL